MVIFTCKDQFEDMMCCIYTAWERALRIGHDNVRLLKEPVEQMTLFDEYIHVDYDDDRFNKVVRSIKSKISDSAYFHVYYACLSDRADAIDIAYRFLIKGFKLGASVLSHMTDRDVMGMLEIKRHVGNEAHYFREFARFTSVDNRLYLCHLEPKCNVIWVVGQHFADRMPSENWIIVDDNRKIGVIHPKDGDNYMYHFSDEQMEVLKDLELRHDEYTDMWKAFFDAIAIRPRENYECQRNLFPIWMRKHAVEFNS